jgi:hypothetical protein
MNASCFRLPALLLAGLFVAACASSKMSRIDANRAVYESWPFEMQQAVLNGEVKQGMTPEMVEMSIGKPSQKDSRPAKGVEDEVWLYKKSGGGGVGSLLSNTGISIGGGLGGVNVGTGMGGRRAGSSINEDQEVVFENGVVIRSDAGK